MFFYASKCVKNPEINKRPPVFGKLDAYLSKKCVIFEERTLSKTRLITSLCMFFPFNLKLLLGPWSVRYSQMFFSSQQGVRCGGVGIYNCSIDEILYRRNLIETTEYENGNKQSLLLKKFTSFTVFSWIKATCWYLETCSNVLEIS